MVSVETVVTAREVTAVAVVYWAGHDDQVAMVEATVEVEMA